jgi:AraC-like DNA-binding protein/mannose-6-phosphate isomerase-like protein (cupin superfamily)
MKQGQDIAVQFPGLYLVHHNLPGMERDRHDHPEHLLFLPLYGEIQVRTDLTTFRAGPGRMVYLPPATPHAFESSEGKGERLIALISTAAWTAAGAPALGSCSVTVSQLCKELLFYLLLHPATPHAVALIATFIHTLSETVANPACRVELSHAEGKVKDVRVRRALEYFSQHLGDELSMESAASASGLSLRSMNRLFQQELERSPKQVLMQYRVRHAQELLLSGATVTQTALDVGYRSLAQFIAVFRQLTGQLPSEVARRGVAGSPGRKQ